MDHLSVSKKVHKDFEYVLNQTGWAKKKLNVMPTILINEHKIFQDLLKAFFLNYIYSFLNSLQVDHHITIWFRGILKEDFIT